MRYIDRSNDEGDELLGRFVYKIKNVQTISQMAVDTLVHVTRQHIRVGVAMRLVGKYMGAPADMGVATDVGVAAGLGVATDMGVATDVGAATELGVAIGMGIVNLRAWLQLWVWQ